MGYATELLRAIRAHGTTSQIVVDIKDKRIAELEQELATAKKALEDTTADYLSLLDINKTMEEWNVHCKAELNAYKRKERLLMERDDG